MSTTVNISIIIQTTDLIKFYKGSGLGGDPDSALVANNFCTIKAVGAISTGINNVFKLAPDTEYVFGLNTTGDDNFILTTEDQMVVSLLKEGGAEAGDWDGIFLPNGSTSIENECLIVYAQGSSPEPQSIKFELQTVGPDSFEEKYNLQYSIAFKMTDGEGTYYGIVDPLIANTSDEESVQK